jgi:hypothetical protein
VLDVFVYSVAAAILAWAGWRAYRILQRRKFQFRLISLFGVTLGCAVFVSLWPVLRAVLFAAENYPPEQWLPARGWEGIDAEPLRVASGMAKGSWSWAIYQWLAHKGIYASFLVALMLVTVWYAARQVKSGASTLTSYWTSNLPERWGALLACIARSSAAAGACFLLFYLAAAPLAVRRGEAQHQYKLGYCRDVAEHWNAIAREQARIQQVRYRQYLAEVEAEMQSME